MGRPSESVSRSTSRGLIVGLLFCIISHTVELCIYGCSTCHNKRARKCTYPHCTVPRKSIAGSAVVNMEFPVIIHGDLD